ncbi:hypothetical protein [Aureimonas sp. AU20]|uniref:hypothetical protein n=1 Tax=Aureimonas sp. AU20 TaxID=1349819 RepID=UPI00071EEAD4|nr:hypothetical protein [Aureimonas sp. AU20]ALN73188.1 hypothetical protein M673_10685 [Aureimonas sp. AU20]
MGDRTEERGVTGLAVTRSGHFAIGLGENTALLALEPAEMRDLATQLLLAAADLEATAAAATEAAIARARGGLQ